MLAPAGVSVALYDGIGALPHFDPDADVDPAPREVARFRAALRAADAVIVSSPEYAHGVPGALKNALDWIVSSGEFADKPLALLTTSRSRYADAQLREILTVLMARIVPEASLALELWSNRVDADSIAAHADVSTALRAALEALVTAARATS